MSWKFVFNLPPKMFEYKDQAARYTKESGYRFYLWEDQVVFAMDHGKWADTGIKKSDLF